ncbi:MAG TPA: hypothetical protein VJ255_16205, partial [Candidatus Acidoferrum sp.]|nr:hypothetical protein [Candidatus Acidoferrum sp.]
MHVKSVNQMEGLRTHDQPESVRYKVLIRPGETALDTPICSSPRSNCAVRSKCWSPGHRNKLRRNKLMNEARIARIAFAVTFWLAAVLPLCDTAVAQKANVSGVIVGSSGATVTVKSQDAGMVAVLLSDNTDIRETEGLFQLRKKRLDLKALVPGLPVQMKGSYNAQNQLVAESVRFKSADLKTANSIQAGIVPQEQQIQAHQLRIEQSEQQIKEQQAAMQQQQKAIQQQ